MNWDIRLRRNSSSRGRSGFSARSTLWSRSGFTLIELLVVIAVIGVLISILIPALQSAKRSARRLTCASTLRQVGVGLLAYVQENRDVFPEVSIMPSIGPAPLLIDNPVYIADVLKNFTGKNPKAFLCPADETDVGRPAPNFGKSYFESERSSYIYRTRLLNGRNLADVKALLRRFGMEAGDNEIWLMSDYDNFHGEGGKPGARRYVYIDGHVGDYEF